MPALLSGTHPKRRRASVAVLAAVLLVAVAGAAWFLIGREGDDGDVELVVGDEPADRVEVADRADRVPAGAEANASTV